MSLWTRWTDGEREAPEPLEGPVVATVVVGTVIWFLLFVGQLPFYGWFADHGHAWWVWTCGAGAGLGLVGLWYVRRREEAIRRGAATPPSSDTPEPPAGGSEPPAGAVRAATPSSRPDGHPAR